MRYFTPTWQRVEKLRIESHEVTWLLSAIKLKFPFKNNVRNARNEDHVCLKMSDHHSAARSEATNLGDFHCEQPQRRGEQMTTAHDTPQAATAATPLAVCSNARLDVVRVQLSRAKGWRLPPNTVIVARPSAWGNEYRVWRDEDGQWYCSHISCHWEVGNKAEGMVMAVKLHAETARKRLATYGGATELLPLRGKNLACWCPLDQPCHADTLLALANETSNVKLTSERSESALNVGLGVDKCES